MATIELRQSPFSRTRGAIEVTADQLSISIPSYLGKRIWQIPLNAIVLVAAEAAEQLNLVPQPSDFVRGLRIPYFHEARTISDPNLLLLFRTPLAAPLLERSRTDVLGPVEDLPVLLDGVSFRVLDAVGARATLATAGVAEVTHPVRWVRSHRAERADQERIAALAGTRRWRRIEYWTAPALLLVASFLGLPPGQLARGVETAGAAGFIGLRLFRKRRAPARLTLE